jgi:hypothetical protein
MSASVLRTLVAEHHLNAYRRRGLPAEDRDWTAAAELRRRCFEGVVASEMTQRPQEGV